MSKKKINRPRTMLLPVDRLSIQLGFMNNVMAGYLLKLMLYYCLDDVKTVDDMIKEVKGMSDSSIVLMAFAENAVFIKENLASYNAKCEKNRLIAVAREEKRRLEREANNNIQTSTTNAQTSTNVHERERTSTYTNTNTNTNTNSSSLHSEELSLSPNGDIESEEREAREVISFINDKCGDNLATLAPLTKPQAIWIYKSCSRRAWQKILTDLDDLPELKSKHLKQFKAYETFYNHRKANGTLEPKS